MSNRFAIIGNKHSGANHPAKLIGNIACPDLYLIEAEQV